MLIIHVSIKVVIVKCISLIFITCGGIGTMGGGMGLAGISIFPLGR